ncbi:hypothetical protein SADUNF_Sadunf09G0011300 [Salix dunnii]|uniref:Transcription factor MYC/MYB N-terminal domain-containing protein n=1 Tax=Salix dunnii TaxID=1413687 RepID=A0A835JRP3_9ROSI|nr:hypothetical protein SADUNF_Sadunf09G0011300 [Salix dunnii]
MMENNQVIIVGEGIVGLAAFTGSHEWILANNCRKDTHSPEVLNEVHHQFSAGLQTIAVVPVWPHGVLQLGSSLAIFCDVGAQNHVIHNKNESDSLAMSYVRTSGGHSLASPAGSHISVQLPNEMGGQTRPNSIPCSLSKLPKLADINHSSTFLAGVEFKMLVHQGQRKFIYAVCWVGLVRVAFSQGAPIMNIII